MLARFLPDALNARSRAIFALLVIMALLAALPSTIAAQEARGALFTGMGFIDDHSVEDGVVVEAWIRGRPVAATEIFNQGFILYVSEPPGESFEGEVVRFKFRGLETKASASWAEGTESWVLLYAYTGLQGNPDGFNVNVTTDSEPDGIIAIKELQARLSRLGLERSEFAAILDRQVRIEIADVTNRWEGAIAELRADVQREIQAVKRQFELERRRIDLGPRREAMLKMMSAEFDAFVQDLWANFESESRLKRRFLRDEIIEIEQARDRELNNLNQLIYQVESELEKRLALIGMRFDEFRETGVIEYPVYDVDPRPDRPPDEEKDEPIPPESPSPEESGRGRGFFFNSVSADPNGLNTLDPTTLAVIGILITLAATGVQLLKGN